MKIRCLLITLVLAFFLSCQKDNDAFATGTVMEQSGCFADSYLVAIDNPGSSTQPFLRPTVLTCVACYNCSNAVFIRLSSPFSTIGAKIKFSYIETELTCLSSSEAPNHITVKNLSRL